MKATWSVIAVYGGARARETAVSFCETLVDRFWSRFDFDVNWLSFEMLANNPSCQEGARKAAEADLIVFATETREGLPRHVQSWIEKWLEDRREREGALAALQAEDLAFGDSTARRYLRQVAHRAGMDFLTEVPEHIHDPFEDSPEVYAVRAKQVTSVLDGILRQPPPSSFY